MEGRMTTYLFVTDPQIHNPSSIDDSGDDWWSCCKATTIGDTALVYLLGGPGIAYEWKATSAAQPHKVWRYICYVRHVRTLDAPISIQEIKSLIPRDIWAAPYTNFRGVRCLRIPDEAAEALRNLRL